MVRAVGKSKYLTTSTPSSLRGNSYHFVNLWACVDGSRFVQEGEHGNKPFISRKFTQVELSNHKSRDES